MNTRPNVRDALNVAHSMLTIVETGASLSTGAWDERMALIESALGLDTPRAKAHAPNQIRTYRVNTGQFTTKTFEASSVAEACRWVRENSFPNYAFPRWLEVRAQGAWVRVV